MKIQQRIYELKALGTLYYSPKTIQDHLRDIHFEPNTLGRYAAMMKPKKRDFAKM